MQTLEESTTYLPRVAVCLAAYNGVAYLDQQISSILAQTNVRVTVFVSVDKSSDQTEQLVDQYMKIDSRVIALPHGEVLGSSAKNFFRIMLQVDFSRFDFISFADQDDIWERDKLQRHISLAETYSADGVSSNVMAFWPTGKKKLIIKSQMQTKWDFLFESSGPGCTFLMTPWLVKLLKSQLNKESGLSKDVSFHDWFAYAVCRSSGRNWLIDTHPSVLYRQHGSNVIGANSGLRAKWARIVKLKEGWYRSEIKKMCKISLEISEDAEIRGLLTLLESSAFVSQLKLLRYVLKARRKISDRVFLLLAVLFFLF